MITFKIFVSELFYENFNFYKKYKNGKKESLLFIFFHIYIFKRYPLTF